MHQIVAENHRVDKKNPKSSGQASIHGGELRRDSIVVEYCTRCVHYKHSSDERFSPITVSPSSQPCYEYS